MIDPSTTRLDSAEGMQMLLDFARAHRLVLGGWHKDLTEKYALDTSGVTFSSEMPVSFRGGVSK